MNLFTAQINNWSEWGKLFQDIKTWHPLIKYIFQKEKLPFTTIENLTPGTNAVFKVGEYVVKIFAPAQSGIDQSLDLQTELFATKRANALGISVPGLITDGLVEDKYQFSYMITEYIEGIELGELVKSMTYSERFEIGRKLRDITDKMNIPCEPFNGIDVINDKDRYHRWDNYSEQFKAERIAYIKSFNYCEMVFVHGDLCLDNIIATPQNELYIIDFADAVLAPKIYEHALMPFSFELNAALMRGYFYDYTKEGFFQMCFDGLLIHDFGGDIVKDFLGSPGEIKCLDVMRERIHDMIMSDKEDSRL